jgi:hypothetical protein
MIITNLINIFKDIIFANNAYVLSHLVLPDKITFVANKRIKLKFLFEFYIIDSKKTCIL